MTSPGEPPVSLGEREVPMFPLGTPLLPAMLLPLHVFEDRYRAMFTELTAGALASGRAAEFGVVMIERGSEVGGGEVRRRVGCLAQVVQHEQQSDGRWLVAAVGVRRIEVTDWLPDDPYPRALVIDRSDSADERSPEALSAERSSALVSRVRALGALAVELGLPGSIDDPGFSAEPAVLVDQLAIAAPLGALDRQRLLEATPLTRRADLLEELIADQELLLHARLEFGGGPDELPG